MSTEHPNLTPITREGTAEPAVSVVVPVRDNPAGIRALLERLGAQTLPAERFEIVIGDDGSAPGSLSGVEAVDDRVRVVHGPPRTSYAARNRAASAARGTALAFCDSDCLPEPEWLERGLEALTRADLVAGEVTFALPDELTAWSLLTVDMFLDQERNVRLDQAVTANLLVRRELFDRLGGFDETLPSGGDYDFTRRALELGARLVYAPDAVVRHPTLDGRREFLAKVWQTNRCAAARKARDGLRPELFGLVTFVPVLGVALARRAALRPAFRLYRPRLRAAARQPSWRDDVRTLPILYFPVSYVAGIARARGWLQGRRLAHRSLQALEPESPAGGQAPQEAPEEATRAGRS